MDGVGRRHGLEAALARHDWHADDGSAAAGDVVGDPAEPGGGATPGPEAHRRPRRRDRTDGQSGGLRRRTSPARSAAASAGARRAHRSRALDADGAPGVPGLRAARFNGDVEFRETSPASKDKPAVERIVRAPALETKLQSGLGTIDRATFTEGVSVQDGGRTAKGPTMIYDVAQGTIALGSPAGVTGFVQVSDDKVNRGRLPSGRSTGPGLWQDQRQERAQAGQRPAAGGKAVKRPSS